VSELPFVQEVHPVDNRLVVTLDNPETRNPEIVRRWWERAQTCSLSGS